MSANLIVLCMPVWYNGPMHALKFQNQDTMTRQHTHGVYPVDASGLTIYRVKKFDAYPQLKHAIFTRKGGVSQAPFRALNLSISVGDDPEAVASNTRYACQVVNASPEQTVSCHLVHGAKVITVTKANQQRVMGQADGLITGEPDIFLFMRFGDCTPLIFFDPAQKAIGLTHAGWRGTMQNAAGATVQAMAARLGCRPKNIMAVIGPSIGPCCYEVGPDVMAAAANSLVDSDKLFTSNGRPHHACFDMWAANRRQLSMAGVEQIVQSNLCTACRTDEFFSHRAEKGRTGRFGVIIGLAREPA